MLPLMGPLVKQLERFLPIVEPDIERPMYLNTATTAVPDAAVEAARNETIRLYDISVGVIASGLSIQQQVFDAESKPKAVIRQSTNVIEQDIDDIYERKIKALYGAIIEFTISTRGGYAKGMLKEEMNALRGAGQHVVEAVKGVKHLRKNLNRFLKSENPYIIKEYNKLRFLIVRVLRAIESIRRAGPESTSAMLFHMDPVKLEITEKTEKISAGLDKLIRKSHINVQMATSLMNDINYCREICWDLVEAGLVLFSTSDRSEQSAEQIIALDAHEIAEIMDEQHREPNHDD